MSGNNIKHLEVTDGKRTEVYNNKRSPTVESLLGFRIFSLPIRKY